ncbi:hypothetical protein Q5H93_21705 [Hymenobacter sp. ASUV-10]|uniref:Phage protein n=1 Tax=Hymenobacter aranciens TaxID=3063996 RepID=A0ABT9BGJ5_9BACT|nr:hypothetical protein [Hymenobacter sp. ASUV-10]MDO7877372.1 hypothetical protein [Hymenobacter sp. ASUV-10]
MALKINDKAGIRATFNACPALKEVHVLENGDHYFNKEHAKTAAGEKGKVVTYKEDAKELEDEAPATPTA